MFQQLTERSSHIGHGGNLIFHSTCKPSMFGNVYMIQFVSGQGSLRLRHPNQMIVRRASERAVSLGDVEQRMLYSLARRGNGEADWVSPHLGCRYRIVFTLLRACQSLGLTLLQTLPDRPLVLPLETILKYGS
ncbi:hypothetical protein AG1IA_10298 [Rhizoctonia solani AG-1 IA]|uniref:Uncharacterized protein n=1 Tax=Thanatephorus cucumeris (strain AG1-IA) TaxID=983506 RepID=L8WG25_THACA|nr:hypothetical protein AG1IA_10298 [Rhizoctonia solani AG-1 IA]